MAGSGSERVWFQWVEQQTLAAWRPDFSNASSTSACGMWLIGSTPSKPAALSAVYFSTREPLSPMVPPMMAFLMFRFLAGAEESFSAASSAKGVSVASVPTAAESFRKLRREVSDPFIGLSRWSVGISDQSYAAPDRSP